MCKSLSFVWKKFNSGKSGLWNLLIWFWSKMVGLCILGVYLTIGVCFLGNLVVNCNA